MVAEQPDYMKFSMGSPRTKGAFYRKGGFYRNILMSAVARRPVINDEMKRKVVIDYGRGMKIEDLGTGEVTMVYEPADIARELFAGDADVKALDSFDSIWEKIRNDRRFKSSLPFIKKFVDGAVTPLNKKDPESYPMPGGTVEGW